MRTAHHGNLFAKLNYRNLDGAWRGSDSQGRRTGRCLIEMRGLSGKPSSWTRHSRQADKQLGGWSV